MPKDDGWCFDQSYDVGAFYHLRVVPLTLASRTVLQVDQATPAHQALLRHLGERREDTSLDRGRCVRVSCHRSQASQSGVVLHEMLQILSITPFEKTPLFQLLTHCATNENIYDDPNQLILL
jgi:hypothetical protein